MASIRGIGICPGHNQTLPLPSLKYQHKASWHSASDVILWVSWILATKRPTHFKMRWNELEFWLSEASVSTVQTAGFQHEYHEGAGPQMNLSRI